MIGNRQKNKLICGFGLNDFKQSIIINDKIMYEYKLWTKVLNRCYSKKYHITRPTYIGCYVEEYLHSFTNFYNFIHTVKGYGQIDKKGKIFQLDKDILSVGNKCYSRETICFVPQEINTFLTSNKIRRGEYIIGVFKDERCNGYFYSYIQLDNKRKHLGSFKTELEAFNAYKEAKELQAKVLAERWKDKIDERVYNALMNYKVEITD